MTGRMVAVAGLVVAALLSLAWAYASGGGARAGVLDRTGPFVLWGLPAVKLLFNIAGATAVGALVVSFFALPAAGAARGRAVRIAAYSSAIASVSALLFSLLSFIQIVNVPLFEAGFAAQLPAFLTQVSAGRAGAVAVLIMASVSVLCLMRPGARAVPFIALLAFAGLVPLVINSHAEGGRDHADSTVSLILHIGAAAVWVGGLLALFLLVPALRGAALHAAIHRYSTLALVSFTSLAASGLLAAWAATGSWEALASPYGAILTAKAVVLIMLGVVGVLHRQWIQKRLAADAGKARRWFVLLAAAELVVMGVASGLAAALARTQPPAGTDTTAPGISALPEPGLGSYLAQWSLDPLWSIACGLAAFLYLAGVQRVRRAGGHWPAARTASWLLGLGILAVVTSGGIHVYQAYLFSAHVLTQMLLTSIVPLFLVPAAPLTLLAQSARERTDGSLGGRELVLGAARPLLSAATAAPYIPAFAIAGSLIALYYTPLLLSGRSQAGYSIMTLVALFCGCLLTAAIVGNSVSSRYASKGFRLAALAATALLYGVYGSALREQAPVLEVPWYNVAGHPWDGLPAAAAETGGVAMWILGAIGLGACALAVIAEKPAAAVPEQAPATPAPEVSSTAR